MLRHRNKCKFMPRTAVIYTDYSLAPDFLGPRESYEQ